MIDRSILKNTEGEYEDSRAQHRLSIPAAMFMMTKGIIATAIFGYHEVFIFNGSVLGSLISIVFIAAVGYGILRMVRIAQEVEDSLDIREFRIGAFHGRIIDYCRSG